MYKWERERPETKEIVDKKVRYCVWVKERFCVRESVKNDTSKKQNVSTSKSRRSDVSRADVSSRSDGGGINDVVFSGVRRGRYVARTAKRLSESHFPILSARQCGVTSVKISFSTYFIILGWKKERERERKCMRERERAKEGDTNSYARTSACHQLIWSRACPIWV